MLFAIRLPAPLLENPVRAALLNPHALGLGAELIAQRPQLLDPLSVPPGEDESVERRLGLKGDAGTTLSERFGFWIRLVGRRIGFASSPGQPHAVTAAGESVDVDRR